MPQMQTDATKKSARVERRGRFTITEIDSPSSNMGLSSPVYSDAAPEATNENSASDANHADHAGAMASSEAARVSAGALYAGSDQPEREEVGGVLGEPASDKQSVVPAPLEIQALDVAITTVMRGGATVDQVDQHELPSMAVSSEMSARPPTPSPGSSLSVVTTKNQETTTSMVSATTSNGSVNMTTLAAAAAGETPRASSSRSLSDRRVQRKGRFTIIELSSTASPTHLSSEDDDMLFQESVASGTDGESAAMAMSTSSLLQRTASDSSFSHDESISRSPPIVEVAPTTTTTTTRRPRERSTSGHLASMMRMRSVSPVRAGAEQPARDTSTSASSFGSLPFRHRAPSAGWTAESFGTSPKTSSVLDPALASVLPVDKRQSQTQSLSLSQLSQPQSSQVQSLSQSQPAPATVVDNRPIERRTYGTHQKAITISTDQFLQQQQTIASLIRQQQELKQLIGVLQEQQQHLMNFPMQLSELKREQAQSDAQNEAMRDVRLHVDALTRANESLQSLLTQAENDAQERTMEMECLSLENDELRHRCAVLERKYQDERKISFAFETEAKQLRMHMQYVRSQSPQPQLSSSMQALQQQPHQHATLPPSTLQMTDASMLA